MSANILIVLFMLIVTVTGYSFTVKHSSRLPGLLRAKVEVADSASIVPGKSLLVKTPTGEVIVANLKGKFYAVDAKCPHLGKCMVTSQLKK